MAARGASGRVLPPRVRDVKVLVAFRLTAEALRLLRAMALIKGLSQASTLEVAIRETAKREKVK